MPELNSNQSNQRNQWCYFCGDPLIGGIYPVSGGTTLVAIWSRQNRGGKYIAKATMHEVHSRCANFYLNKNESVAEPFMGSINKKS